MLSCLCNKYVCNIRIGYTHTLVPVQSHFWFYISNHRDKNCWCLISRSAKQARAFDKVSGSLIARVPRSFLLESSYRDCNANTRKRTTDGSSSGTVRRDLYGSVTSWRLFLAVLFSLFLSLFRRLPSIKAARSRERARSTLFSLAYPRDTLDGRSARREKSKRGLRRRDSMTTTTAKRRERASSRSSEIVTLPCLRASYRRYLFRRAAKQLADPVGPASR